MEWNENEHPRDEDGKFTDGGAKEYRQNTGYSDIVETGKKDTYSDVRLEAETAETPEEITQLYGEEFSGYKGQAAIDKLLKEKRGHVKAAFHRDDVGDIDLLWGNDFVGVRHIIKQREAQNINVDDFLSELSVVIEQGQFRKRTNRGDFEFIKDGKLAVITASYHENKIQFLLTAYKTRYK